MAVRLGRLAGSDRLVRRALDRLASLALRGRQLAAAFGGPLAGADQPVYRGPARPACSRPARRRALVGPDRHRGAGSQLLADLRVRHLLARAGHRQCLPRRCLPRPQSVAGDRARRRRGLQAGRRPIAAAAADLPRAAWALARRRRRPRLRLARARLRHQRLSDGWADPAHRRRRGARLQRLHACRDGPLRLREVARARRGVLGLLRDVREPRPASRSATADSACGGCSRRQRAGCRCRDRSH